MPNDTSTSEYLPWFLMSNGHGLLSTKKVDKTEKLMKTDGPVRPDQIVPEKMPTQTHGGGLDYNVIRAYDSRKKSWRR